MAQRQKHHKLPKQIQRQLFNYPQNDGVYDDSTVSLDKEFHQDITNQIRHQGKYKDLPTGVPVAYTLGEIDKKLMEEAWGDEDCDE